MKTRQHYFLALMMLITGSINTITTKYATHHLTCHMTFILMTHFHRYADITCSFGTDTYPKDQDASTNPCPGRSQGEHPFDHPFVQVGMIPLRSCLTSAQALAMFVGEFACLLVFKLMVLKARCSNKVRNHIRAEAFELA